MLDYLFTGPPTDVGVRVYLLAYLWAVAVLAIGLGWEAWRSRRR